MGNGGIARGRNKNETLAESLIQMGQDRIGKETEASEDGKNGPEVFYCL